MVVRHKFKINQILKFYLMKNISKFRICLLLIMSIIFVTNAVGQSDSTANRHKDTTRIVLGKKEIQIIDRDKGTDIQVRPHDEKDDNGQNTNHDWNNGGLNSGGFKGHWDGIEVGLNNYLASNGSMSLPDDINYMSLRTSRSINFNLNFFQQSFGLIGNQVGLVTGLGFEFYNYFFQNNNSILRGTLNGSDYVIENKYSINIDKSKLAITYLTIPLILEVQFPGKLVNAKRIRLAGGIIGGLKLRSHTKVIFHEDGDRHKEKNYDDFYINPFRYGFTGRIGYRHLAVFCDYYPVSLFQKNRGPELYPIAFGLCINGL